MVVCFEEIRVKRQQVPLNTWIKQIWHYYLSNQFFISFLKSFKTEHMRICLGSKAGENVVFTIWYAFYIPFVQLFFFFAEYWLDWIAINCFLNSINGWLAYFFFVKSFWHWQIGILDSCNGRHYIKLMNGICCFNKRFSFFLR